MNAHGDVYITGCGLLSAAGIGRRDAWETVAGGSALPGERGYRLSDGRTLHYPVYGLPSLAWTDWIDRRALAWLEEEGLIRDPDWMYLLLAARQALDEAGWDGTGGERTGLVIGHENLGVNRLIDQILTGGSVHVADRSGSVDPMAKGAIQAGPQTDPFAAYEAYRDEFFRLQSFPYLFYLGKALGTGGASYTVNNACASGLYALELGRQLIASGQADRVVAVCSDYAHVTEHLWLSRKGFSSASGMLRPFDAHRDGAVLGDGAAAVVLESAEQVERRGIRPLCRYKGGRFRQDGWHLALPDVTLHSYADVIHEAASRFAPDGLDLLVPHGTGIPLWDVYEAAEIRAAFTRLGRPLPPMTAFKGALGHTLGASALVETALLLTGLEQGLIAPAVHHTAADARIGLPLVSSVQPAPLHTVMKTVSAYGGFQAAAVFESIK